MLNEVLRLVQGDFSGVVRDEKNETDENNEAFYKDYTGENHDWTNYAMAKR